VPTRRSFLGRGSFLAESTKYADTMASNRPVLVIVSIRVCRVQILFPTPRSSSSVKLVVTAGLSRNAAMYAARLVVGFGAEVRGGAAVAVDWAVVLESGLWVAATTIPPRMINARMAPIGMTIRQGARVLRAR
jgi:hypothetical protein